MLFLKTILTYCEKNILGIEKKLWSLSRTIHSISESRERVWNGILFKLSTDVRATDSLTCKLEQIIGMYRVSHGKVNKVIWLCWGYSFWFLLIFWVLCIYEKGTFMLNLSVFFFMFRALYGQLLKTSCSLINFELFWLLGAFLSNKK